MIQITNKADCCGCGACAAACPRGCIRMQSDEEGFLYPVVDEAQCVHCGLCLRACPIRNGAPETPVEQQAFLAQHKDEAIRAQSTSGGAFTAVAMYVLRRGGVVFGAAYAQDRRVRHTYVERENELSIFRGSKYVQSDTGDSFRQVRSFLREGRWVCFSGTPCQAEGLLSFLGEKPERLLLVDVVCHAAPSPLVWDRFQEAKAALLTEDASVVFRDKQLFGYNYSNLTIRRDGRVVYAGGLESDPMLRLFFSSLSIRPACESCRFKKRYQPCDLTLWDCFSVYDFSKEMDDDKGCTRVLVHSALGREVMREAERDLRLLQTEPDKLVRGVKELVEAPAANPRRAAFFADAARMDGPALFAKYVPVTPQVRVKRMLRIALVKTGLNRLAKRCVNKLRGR